MIGCNKRQDDINFFFSTENMNKTFTKKKKKGNFGEEENDLCT